MRIGRRSQPAAAIGQASTGGADVPDHDRAPGFLYALGLAIIASEPREFVIVNIVGSIDLEKLHELEGKFGVPELQIEADDKVPPAKTTAPKK